MGVFLEVRVCPQPPTSAVSAPSEHGVGLPRAPWVLSGLWALGPEGGGLVGPESRPQSGAFPELCPSAPDPPRDGLNKAGGSERRSRQTHTPSAGDLHVPRHQRRGSCLDGDQARGWLEALSCHTSCRGTHVPIVWAAPTRRGVSWAGHRPRGIKPDSSSCEVRGKSSNAWKPYLWVTGHLGTLGR